MRAEDLEHASPLELLQLLNVFGRKGEAINALDASKIISEHVG